MAKGGQKKNQLYYGDNFEVMQKYIDDDSVDLCYMDPPFNSKRNYNQIYNDIGEDRAQAQAFIDTWRWDDHARAAHKAILANDKGRYPDQLIQLVRGLHGVLGEKPLFAYVVGMALRIAEIQRALKSTGSFFLHCDPTASHYLKIVADTIFCSQGGNFQNEIVWKRTGAHTPKRSFGPVHDTILFYTKHATHYYFNIIKRPYMRGHVETRYKLDEKTGQLQFSSGGNVLTGAGATKKGESGQPWKGFDPSAKNRHWAVPGFLAEQMPEDFAELGVLGKLDALYDAGLIEIDPNTEWPIPVRFLKDGDGNPVGDIWAYQPYTEGTVYGTDKGIDEDVKWLGPTDPERVGWETQKPLGLLDRIIEAACPETGVMFDPCCGCGTTILAAQRANRRWTGIDITYQSIAVILQRLEDQAGPAKWPEVEKNITLTGIPRDMASAVALAHMRDDRLRKEFEKWAVLTYTNNRAKINDKKGADGGIDGRVYFMTSATDSAKMILQVKSGIPNRGDVAQLRGDMEREGAAIATLITLAEPSAPMKAEAKAAGYYEHELMGKDYNRIEIVTIEEIIEDGRRIELPLMKETLKKGRAKKAPARPEPMLPGILDRVRIPPPADMLDHAKKKTTKPTEIKAAKRPKKREDEEA